MHNEIDLEIQKLQERKMELANKLNLVKDLDEKEAIRMQIDLLQKQIDTLERFRTKT